MCTLVNVLLVIVIIWSAMHCRIYCSSPEGTYNKSANAYLTIINNLLVLCALVHLVPEVIFSFKGRSFVLGPLPTAIYNEAVGGLVF